MKHSKVHTNVGLGNNFLNRARTIFILLFLIGFAFLSTVAYASYQSGEFEKQILSPVKKSVLEFAKAFEEREVNPIDQSKIIDSTKTQTNSNNSKDTLATPTTAEYQYGTGSKSVFPTATFNYTYPTLAPLPNSNMKSYEELLKEQEAWSQQKSSDNQKWFEEQTEKAKQEQEEWKKQNGF